jgi:hypothetical protein
MYACITSTCLAAANTAKAAWQLTLSSFTFGISATAETLKRAARLIEGLFAAVVNDWVLA